jgi:DNA-binding transcriptional MocR family regulator
MSLAASRAVWHARRAGVLCGRERLLVALAIADQAQQPTGELRTTSRALARLCGVNTDTVTAALRELTAAGMVERVERGNGGKPSRFIFTAAVSPNGTDAELSTHEDNPVFNGEAVSPNGTAGTPRPSGAAPRPSGVDPASVPNAGTESSGLETSKQVYVKTNAPLPEFAANMAELRAALRGAENDGRSPHGK